MTAEHKISRRMPMETALLQKTSPEKAPSILRRNVQLLFPSDLASQIPTLAVKIYKVSEAFRLHCFCPPSARTTAIRQRIMGVKSSSLGSKHLYSQYQLKLRGPCGFNARNGYDATALTSGICHEELGGGSTACEQAEDRVGPEFVKEVICVLVRDHAMTSASEKLVANAPRVRREGRLWSRCRQYNL